jgi:oligopeptidase A
VELEGRSVGRINFDLWSSQARLRGANTTRGIRNRTEYAGIVQQPVAYVSCRFERASDGTDRINFQNVHSLFHEFGHAVNHLLIRRRMPNESGLDSLPLERLEILSMWFEKWVYHPSFGQHLTMTSDGEAGLKVAQEVKRLEYQRTHVERGVTAAVDLLIHAAGSVGFLPAFHELDEQYGISSCCSPGDFPVYFTWPMFQANPGANFVYLWGSAYSSQRFVPFTRQPLEKAPDPGQVRAAFGGSFDFDQPCEEPDSAAIFDFYDSCGSWARR